MATVQIGGKNVTYDPGAVLAAGSRGNKPSDIQGALSALETGSLANTGRAGGYLQEIINKGWGYEGGRDVRSAALAYLQRAGGSFDVRIPEVAKPDPVPIDKIIEDLSRSIKDSASTGNDEIDSTQGEDNRALYSADSPYAVLADLFSRTFGADADTATPTTEYVPVDTFGAGQAPSRGGGMAVVLLLLAAAGAGYYFLVYRR